MAYSKDNKYWKLIAFGKLDRISKSCTAIVQAYKSKAAADANDTTPPIQEVVKDEKGKPIHQKPWGSLLENRKHIVLAGDNYPFVNEASPNMIAEAYAAIKVVDSYFADAETV